MNWQDHAPKHFHAKYGDHEISVEILTGKTTGYFPPKALGLVHEWCALHTEELIRDWELAQNHEPLKKITPLD